MFDQSDALKIALSVMAVMAFMALIIMALGRRRGGRHRYDRRRGLGEVFDEIVVDRGDTFPCKALPVPGQPCMEGGYFGGATVSDRQDLYPGAGWVHYGMYNTGCSPVGDCSMAPRSCFSG